MTKCCIVKARYRVVWYCTVSVKYGSVMSGSVMCSIGEERFCQVL